MTWHVADGAMQRAPLHDPDNIPCSTNHAPPVPGVSALPVQPPQQHRQPTCDPAPMTPPGDAEIYSCFLSRKRPCLMPDNRPLLPKEPNFAALHEVKDIRIHQILIRRTSGRLAFHALSFLNYSGSLCQPPMPCRQMSWNRLFAFRFQLR